MSATITLQTTIAPDGVFVVEAIERDGEWDHSSSWMSGRPLDAKEQADAVADVAQRSYLHLRGQV
jgi:hypothetical protein